MYEFVTPCTQSNEVSQGIISPVDFATSCDGPASYRTYHNSGNATHPVRGLAYLAHRKL